MLIELLVWVNRVIIRSLFASAWRFAILIRSMRSFQMYSIFARIVIVAKTRSHLITTLSAHVIFSQGHCLARLVNFVRLYALAWPSFVVFWCFGSIFEFDTLLGYELFCWRLVLEKAVIDRSVFQILLLYVLGLLFLVLFVIWDCYCFFFAETILRSRLLVLRLLE